MRKLAAALLFAFLSAVSPARAQLSQATVNADINTMLQSCGNGCNTAASLRALLDIMTTASFQSQGANGLTLSGTPSVGYVPIATGATAAVWTNLFGAPNTWTARQTFSADGAGCTMLDTGTLTSCSVYINLPDTTAAAEWGMVMNMAISHNNGAGPNTNFKGGLNWNIALAPGSASAWGLNGNLVVTAGTDLSNAVANNIEIDSTNRAAPVGMAQGSAGITFLANNVTGITMNGGDTAAGQYSYPQTYAYNVTGPGNARATTINAARTSGNTTITVASTIFQNGDIIRIWQGSAGGVGFNGTLYNGKVTAGGGTVGLTITPALTANVGVGDWVLDTNSTVAVSSAIWDRGYVCQQSIIQGCLHIYGNMEKGIEFNGAQTDIGIDFTGNGSLHAGFPVDIVFGTSHSVYYESVSGTQYKSAWIFDTSDIWQLFPRIQSNDTTQSTSASTGSVVLLGGIGVAKNAWVGGALVTQPVTFSALPTCNAGIQGARAFVTDQNTAVAYHGAVSGSGTGKQGVTCDGTAWYQD